MLDSHIRKFFPVALFTQFRDEDDEFEELDNVVERVMKMVSKPLLSVADHPIQLDLKVAEYENFEKRSLSNQVEGKKPLSRKTCRKERTNILCCVGIH